MRFRTYWVAIIHIKTKNPLPTGSIKQVLFGNDLSNKLEFNCLEVYKALEANLENGNDLLLHNRVHLELVPWFRAGEVS
jgi:hypothetical protein